MAFEFKRKNSLEKRKQLSARILESYPGRVPVIVERAPNSRLPNIQKTKYVIYFISRVQECLVCSNAHIRVVKCS